MLSNTPKPGLLTEYVRWPLQLTETDVVERLRRTKRFIDFDDTLIDCGHRGSDARGVYVGRLRDPFCSKSLRAFLAEVPYAIQTWHLGPLPEALFDPAKRSEMSASFPERFRFLPEGDTLPKPELIFTPPHRAMPLRPGEEPREFDVRGERHYKDFEALGIVGATIYDDEPWYVHAPSCRIIGDF